MKSKQRLSASVDADLIRAAEGAAKRGQVASVSAWVNDALRLKLEHDQRLRALDAFIHAYETEHGEITHEEIELASRRANSRAVAVRALAPGRAPTVRRRRGAG